MSGSGEGNSLDARNPHLRRVIADAWMGNLGLCKGMRHINLKSSLFSGWSKPTPDELLIIPSWCFVEDPEVQFPPPEDFALDHFILHVSPPVGVYHKGSFRLSVDVRREEDGAMPKVVVYNRLWHPNVDIDGTIAPTVLKRFSDELNEGDAKNVCWPNGVFLSAFLLRIVTMLLDDGYAHVKRTISLQELRKRLHLSRESLAVRAEIEEKVSRLQSQAGCSFFMHEADVMNREAWTQLQLTCICLKPQCSCDPMNRSLHKKFDEKAETWAQKYGRPILVEPHRCVRWAYST